MSVMQRREEDVFLIKGKDTETQTRGRSLLKLMSLLSETFKTRFLSTRFRIKALSTQFAKKKKKGGEAGGIRLLSYTVCEVRPFRSLEYSLQVN